MKLLLLFILPMVVCFTSCIDNVTETKPEVPADGDCCPTYGSQIIYKTTHNYRDNVLITLSDDGTEVIGYPAITDVESQRPVPLNDGYFLKKMPGNAFISMSIGQYAKLYTEPTDSELLQMVDNMSPFLEYYDCCNICVFSVEDANNAIADKRLFECNY